MRTYGHDETWHNTKFLAVEINEEGIVVAVWFRCTMLPFTQTTVSQNRSKLMLSVKQFPELHAVILKDKEEPNAS